VRDITSGMKKALANREETLKVVSEVLKAPIPVLDTYLLKDNDCGYPPGPKGRHTGCARRGSYRV
jgi:hypothetical protein